MKIQKHLGYLAVAIAATSLAMPMSAFAQDSAEASSSAMQSNAMQEGMPQAKKYHHKKHYKKSCRKSMKYSCCKRWSKYCYKYKVCQVKPAHWWNTTWIPASKECWWVKR